jgi:hypothetical protein
LAKEFHGSHEDWREGIGMRLLETENRQKQVKWKLELCSSFRVMSFVNEQRQ